MDKNNLVFECPVIDVIEMVKITTQPDNRDDINNKILFNIIDKSIIATNGQYLAIIKYDNGLSNDVIDKHVITLNNAILCYLKALIKDGYKTINLFFKDGFIDFYVVRKNKHTAENEYLFIMQTKHDIKYPNYKCVFNFKLIDNNECYLSPILLSNACNLIRKVTKSFCYKILVNFYKDSCPCKIESINNICNKNVTVYIMPMSGNKY